MSLIQDVVSMVQHSIGTEGAVANCRRELHRREVEQREVAALAARLALRPPAVAEERRSA